MTPDHWTCRLVGDKFEFALDHESGDGIITLGRRVLLLPNDRGKAGNLTKRRGGRVVPRRFLLSHQVSCPELVGRKRLSRYFVYRATRMPCAATPISARNATWSPRIYWTAKRCSRLPVPGRLSKVVLPSEEWPSAAERCSSVSEGRCRRARPSAKAPSMLASVTHRRS